MVWSDQSQFPFEVYDNNGNLIAIINENGITIYGNNIGGQLNIINQAIPGLAIGIQLNQGTGAPLIAFGGRNSTGGKQYFQTFDDQNDNAYEEYAVGGDWRIHNDVDGWRIYNVASGFDGYGFEPVTEELRAIKSGLFTDWINFGLSNGWTGKAGYYAPAYRYTPDGCIETYGTMTGGTNADGTILCAMPVIPAKLDIQTPAISNGGGANSRIFYNTDGKLYCYGCVGATDISLSGLKFRYK
jgi:hypothetical protein